MRDRKGLTLDRREVRRNRGGGIMHRKQSIFNKRKKWPVGKPVFLMSHWYFLRVPACFMSFGSGSFLNKFSCSACCYPHVSVQPLVWETWNPFRNAVELSNILASHPRDKSYVSNLFEHVIHPRGIWKEPPQLWVWVEELHATLEDSRDRILSSWAAVVRQDAVKPQQLPAKSRNLKGA